MSLQLCAVYKPRSSALFMSYSTQFCVSDRTDKPPGKNQRASKLRSVVLLTSDISGHLGLSDLGWEESSFSECLL